MACLRDGLHTADALLHRFRDPSAVLVDRAVDAVGALPPPQRCATPDETESPSEVELGLRRRVAEARAAALATAHETALGIAKSVADEARGIGLDAILGDALQIQGQVQAIARDDTALVVLREAYDLAVASGDDSAAAHRARNLARALAVARRYPEALEWLRHADAAGRRGGQTPEDAVDQAITECWVFHDSGAAADALAACTRGAELAETIDHVAGGPRQEVNRLLALLYIPQGRHDEAEALLGELLARSTAELGATHPATRILVWNLADVASARSDHPEAIRLLREFHATTEAAGGVSNAFVLARSHAELGNYLEYARDFEGALAAYERALDYLAAWAPTPTAASELERCTIRRLRAASRIRQGDTTAALAELREIAELQAELLPPNHFETWATSTLIAHTLLELNEPAAAELEFEKFIPELRRTRHHRLASELTFFGWAAELQGHLGDARERYEEAASSEQDAALAVVPKGRLVDVVVQMGDVEDARRALDELTAGTQLGDWTEATPAASLAFARAVMLAAEGDPAGADVSAREVEELLAAERTRFELDTFDRLLERRLAQWQASRGRTMRTRRRAE
jgi:tetratricopeptide (TPR) repeat protein